LRPRQDSNLGRTV